MKTSRRLAILGSVVALMVFLCASAVPSSNPTELLAGFAEIDITPKLEDGPVYLAGFGQNRKATAVLDPLAVRVVVLRHGSQTIAMACADVVGLFLPSTERVRNDLPDVSYVMVSSTHNHHGPDTMGLWGPTPFVSGVNPDYLKSVEGRIVQAIRDAIKTLRPVEVRIGSVNVPDLLHDSRPPIVKHDMLVALQFVDASTKKPAGVVVQWNCHPETLDSKNTLITSDFVGGMATAIKKKHGCPVVYFTGTVGGLMTSMRVNVRDTAGERLPEGSVQKLRRYEELLTEKVDSAMTGAKPLALAPMEVRAKSVCIPVDNKVFLLGKRLGVVNRPMERWTGDAFQAVTATTGAEDERVAARTEVALLRLGELDVAVIPGEIYPELVLDKVVTPADPGADFPDAPIEPAIYSHMSNKHRMIVGLGNDEIGYILPKRQWDEKPPFTHGLLKAPYGEVNSLGPEAAPILCKTFKELAARKR